MNANPGENKEWFFLGGTAVGALVALLAGAQALAWVAAGTVLGLIFAPKLGRETRYELGGLARRWGSRVVDFVAPSTDWNHEEILPAPPPAGEP